MSEETRGRPQTTGKTTLVQFRVGSMAAEFDELNEEAFRIYLERAARLGLANPSMADLHRFAVIEGLRKIVREGVEHE